MVIFFTADTHFCHAAVIEHSRRPFADLEEMHEALISAWNARVRPGDTVYHLGDFALSWGRKKSVAVIDGLLARLNGHKWLICGNHDREEVTKNPRWLKVVDYHELKIDMGGTHKQRIVLSHYPMLVWNQNHRGSFMIHGHTHGNLLDPGGKIADAGVDVRQFRPWSLGEVVAFMADRPIVCRDHHTEAAADE